MIAASRVLSPAVADSSFQEDVLQGLRAARPEIPSKYFYDETGSRLFDAICELPEYYLTRTELGIMRRHAPEMARLIGTDCLLIEYGSGSSTKTRFLLDHLKTPAAYVPIDISAEHLHAAASRLSMEYPAIDVVPWVADFTRPLTLPPQWPAARPVVYFPGSTIGNFGPVEAVALLQQTARLCAPCGGLLLGADLKKDPAVIHAAYNDAQGVTASFNLNLLARINRELGGTFDLDSFWHYAPYSPNDGRVEMHLVSRRVQDAIVAGERFTLATGASIRTEYSYKYSLHDLAALATASGFTVRRTWMDPRELFAVQYWTGS